MRSILVSIGILICVLVPATAMAALVPPTHVLFDGDAVHEIHITFDDEDWQNVLMVNFEMYDDPPYLAASFDWGSTHLDSIGVRYKGNSSYWGYYGDKKSFKLDLDEFIGGQELDGLDKLNLNNCFLDPSFVREKCAYELCEAMGMATGRTNYAAVYINDTYWGLYLLVEQQDQEFIESRWGASEEGNLWKGEPAATLEYLGALESDYYDSYELKTNEEINDWSDLVDFIDILNNVPAASLADSFHNRVDINSALAMLAIDNFIVNLDSYIGRCANYYMYHRDLDDRFVFTKWDQNESWGIYNEYNLSKTDLQQLSPYWTNPRAAGERPLAEKLLQNMFLLDYKDVYEGHMKKLMAGPALPATLSARMAELRDLIRPYVYADTKMMFSTADFENCMTSDVFAGGGPPPGRVIPALSTFISARHAYLQGVIGTWTPIEGLVLNECMASNNSTLADEYGDYDDWIEIANVGDVSIDLGGLGLTDHFEGTPDFVFPDTTLAPGEYLVVWADEESLEGSLHAPFRLDADGEDIYLTDGAVIIDQISFPSLGSDVPWGRWPNGTGEWAELCAATPGAENANTVVPETVVLYINEFIALNNTGIQDEAGQYEDWVEIFNPGPASVEMGGLYLTDDSELTTQWSFPDTVLEAGGFLVVWCDNDTGDGPLHATFKLSGDGEFIGLYGRAAAGNEEIDSRAFGAQSADVSEGRETDGAETWVAFDSPTPGESNDSATAVPDATDMRLLLMPCYPNPFNPTTTIRFQLPSDGPVRLEVFDVNGRLVSRLKHESMTAGLHEVTWNGTGTRGNPLASGVYFYRLAFGTDRLSGRLVLLR